MTELLMTPREKERMELHNEVCRLYSDFREKYPGAKPYRLFTAIAIKHNLSVAGVAKICNLGGCYQPQKKEEQR